MKVPRSLKRVRARLRACVRYLTFGTVYVILYLLEVIDPIDEEWKYE